MNALEVYKQWCESSYFDEETHQALLAMADDADAINESFYTDLEFGTAGLRGIIGVGTNRMNRYTVRKATQGLANYILSEKEENPSVVIAFDSRHMSPEFADESARTLAANGIKAYVFESLRPTPELSFAIRELGCIAGINITASHNPSNYNGYKVYWRDGAQITPPHDTGIMKQVRAIADYAQVRTMSKEDAVSAGLYEIIGKAVDDRYLEEVKKLILHPEAIAAQQKDICIVYTPLHGTGYVPVMRVLEEAGFTNVHVVKEQAEPDGDFPTVPYPNPETEDAFTLGLKLAGEVGADLVLATDPDADRLGVHVRDKDGEYHPLTGNMSGCLIGDYIIGQKKELGLLTGKEALVRSIVSTNMADAIADHYGIRLVEVLTGFKYIGQKILEYETDDSTEYVFGMEESYGCLAGTYARDKDAVAASLILCEAAAFYRQKGMTLWDAMLQMYKKYGYYKDYVKSITLEGKAGIEKIQQIMQNLREQPRTKIGSSRVCRMRDYKSGIVKDLVSGEETKTDLPEANVLYYELEDQAWICARPSGTEPKLKLYYGVKGDTEEEVLQRNEELYAALDELTKEQ
jgi:phosphoglucomutase